jgi:hypothetical protein
MNSHSSQAVAVVSLLAALLFPCIAQSAVEDLPGMDTATNMKEWLKLSDDQVAKLKPLIATRIQKMEAAIAKVEAAEEPDVVGFIEERGKIKKEFDQGAHQILTPDQKKQWESFKTELEKDLVQSAAKKQVEVLQSSLKLSDDQAKKLLAPLATATQKKIDVFQQLSDGTRVSLRDKIKAKRAMGQINGELEKAMAAVLSPAQLEDYKKAAAKKG